MNTRVEGLTAVCCELCGRSMSRAVGNTKADVTIKKTSSRNTTSVIDAMENVASISCCRLSAMRGVSVFACRLVEQVHEVHGAGFEAVHDFIDAGYKEVVGEERHDTHYEACNGGDEGGVDAVGKRVDSR